MSRRSRLLRWLNRETPRVTIGLAPMLSAYHVSVNPRKSACCGHCAARWSPADCPVTHTEPCPECEGDAA
jgi:hypothetical protein